MDASPPTSYTADVNYPPHAPGPPAWGAPPPPRKRSLFWPLFAGFVVLLLGSCVGLTAYTIYRADDPEAQREAQEEEDRYYQRVDAFIAKIGRVHAAVHAAGKQDVPCPAGARIESAPLVDTIFLDALFDGTVFRWTTFDEHDGKPRTQQLVASKVLRDAAFSDAVFEVVTTRRADAGASNKLWDAVRDIDRLRDKPFLLVLRVDALKMPIVHGSDLEKLVDMNVAYEAGELRGAAFLVDWKTERIACHRALSVESSSEITYRKQSNLENAVKENFRWKVGEAARAALQGTDGN